MREKTNVGYLQCVFAAWVSFCMREKTSARLNYEPLCHSDETAPFIWGFSPSRLSDTLVWGWAHRPYLHFTLSQKSSGLVRDLNPGPLAPKARIIPLDQRAAIQIPTTHVKIDHFTITSNVIDICTLQRTVKNSFCCLSIQTFLKATPSTCYTSHLPENQWQLCYLHSEMLCFHL